MQRGFVSLFRRTAVPRSYVGRYAYAPRYVQPYQYSNGYSFTRYYASKGSADLSTSAEVPDLLLPPSARVGGMQGSYAHGLFHAAKSRGKLDVVAKDIEKLQRILDDDKVVQYLTSPVIASNKKLKALHTVLKRISASGITLQFIALVTRNNRLDHLQAMCHFFMDLHANQIGKATGTISSNQEIPAADLKKIKDGLLKAGYVAGDVTFESVVSYRLNPIGE